MIHITNIDDGVRALVSCDVCMEPITDAGMAVALRFTHGGVWHAHKGKCHSQAERMVPVFRHGFHELREHLADIERSTRPPAGPVAALEHAPLDLPAPRELADTLMARAWDDDTLDRERLLLEQAALTITYLLTQLVAATERAEARRAMR